MLNPSENFPGSSALYTVVLRRPDYMGRECANLVEMVGVPYSSAVPTDEMLDLALGVAQAQAYAADASQCLEPESPDDYALVALFSGHNSPLKFGD